VLLVGQRTAGEGWLLLGVRLFRLQRSAAASPPARAVGGGTCPGASCCEGFSGGKKLGFARGEGCRSVAMCLHSEVVCAVRSNFFL